MQIIPIASGKGGVGKSLLAANLSIALGQAGKKVVVADLDLGASNLHLALGQKGNKHGVGTFLMGASSFEEIMVPTGYPNVYLVPGDSEIPGFAALKVSQRRALTVGLLKTHANYVVLDLGAGTHLGVLEFFLLSSRGIIVTEPAVSAVLNAYLFLKNVVFKMLCAAFKKGTGGSIFLENLKSDAAAVQRMYVPKILAELERVDQRGVAVLLDRMRSFRPRLVMNMIADPKDVDKALKIRRSCEQYLNITLEYLGVIYQDTQQNVALSSGLPIVVYKPQSLIAQAVYRIADKILQSEGEEASSIEDYEGLVERSFASAEAEAEVDFQFRMDYLEDLIKSKTVCVGDLAEIIKAQQYEIATLRKQNLLLQRKINKTLRNA